MTSPTAPRWLLLIHQIPKSPGYLRAKVGRQLSRVGAVAVKNSVYVLPRTAGALEDFQWIARELQSAGAEATVFEASVVEGVTEAELEERFRAAITPAYEALRAEAAEGIKALRKRHGEADPTAVARLRKRLDELTAINFFAAPAAREAEARVAEFERLAVPPGSEPKLPPVDPKTLVGRTWVTRRGIHVDRIATAWLILRFLDPGARFVWAGKDEAVGEPGALRFDMFGGEFTHEGGLCSFEVLSRRAGLDGPGVRAIAEIIHDLDLKDARFGRPEAPGVGALLNGVCWRHPDDDDARLREGGALLDALHESMTRHPK